MEKVISGEEENNKTAQKVSKSVQKSSRGVNLDFAIFQRIIQGDWPSKIAKDLDMSRTRIDYYISSLKERKLIEMKGQGVWIALKNYCPKVSKKSSRVATNQAAEYLDTFDPDTSRGHGFQFKLELPKNMKNWNNENRREGLKKLEIEFYELPLFGGGQGLIFREKKIHLTDPSIIIYDKASYYAENSKGSQELAMVKILYVIKALERYLRANFSINGYYKIRPTRQHYALIKNVLAMIYNKARMKKLEVKDHKGLWLLIDNSFNLDELECVHPKTSVEDFMGMQEIMNSMKRTDFKVTSEFVLTAMNGIQQNQLIFDNNMKSHIEVLHKLGDAVDKLTDVVEKKQ